jgi:hypothetical protein
MAKDKVTVTISPDVLANLDADAAAAGLNRSEYVEEVLRHEHYRRLLARTPAPAAMPDDEQARLRALLDWQRDAGRSTRDAA